MDRRIWIVGASTGIGAELAGRYAARGDKVVVSARSAEKLTELAAGHDGMVAVPVDVTDAASVAEAAAAAKSALGQIDLLILSAGAWHMMSASKMDIDKLRHGMDVNYIGTLRVIEAVMGDMIARGSGHVAIIASVAGYRGLPRAMAYGPTKAALNNVAETLHAELGRKGILVSVVNPGFVKTPMTENNPFPMPGLVSVERAARDIIDGLDKGRYEITFPFWFSRAMKLLRMMPNRLYFQIVKRMV